MIKYKKEKKIIMEEWESDREFKSLHIMASDLVDGFGIDIKIASKILQDFYDEGKVIKTYSDSYKLK